MKKQKMLAFALTGLLAISAIGLSSGQVVKADTTAVSTVGVTYRGHVQNIGWQPYVSDGAEAGTDGKGFRVEALNIELTNAPSGAHIEYQGHVQNIGWQTPVEDNAEIGTDGKGLRVEALKIALVDMPGYSVQYRAHVQNIGWQNWVSDGAEAGTDGQGLRVEAIQIKIVKTANGSTPTPVAFSPVTTTPTSGGTPVLNDNTDITSKFTDANFKSKVYALIGKSSGDTILYSDVKNIRTLDLGMDDISNLSGVEYFTSLTELDCFLNYITTLDLSKNTKLTKLVCYDNYLTTLDLSKNTALTDLQCEKNNLTTLDVSKNTALTDLQCYWNKLTTLDISKNAELAYLDCNDNNLTTLDASKNTALAFLACQYNQITTLYVNEISTAVDNTYQWTDATHTTLINTLVVQINQG